MINLKKIEAKSCMTKSKITDYVINPYVGCEHGCKYCYADFIRRFQNIKDEWGSFVYAKINCPDLIEKELLKNKPGHIWISSVCDCYMPIEAGLKLTKKILKKISQSKYKNKFSYEIITKSCLVSRDFDLIKELNIELGMSVNQLDKKIAKIIEPFASCPKKRIKTLKDAKKKGIRVFGFISPVLPGITNLEELFNELSFCDYVWVELLNTQKSIMNRFYPIIEKHFKDKIKDFKFALNNPKEYCLKIERQVRELEKKYDLEVRGIVKHNNLN